jgi:hypothetical protein
VNNIIIEVACRLIMTADNESIMIDQRMTKGGLNGLQDVNRVGFTVRGRPYILVYSNYNSLRLRDGNRNGAVIAVLTNMNNSLEIAAGPARANCGAS